MTAIKLTPRPVAKPWGMPILPPMFAALNGDEAVGEIWFELGASDLLEPDLLGQDTPPLLVKYLFTSEKLSVQVHPDDALARRHGHANGKEEAWVITNSAPDATLGLGLTETLSDDALRGAALDGSIEALLDWRKVRAGDHFHVTPGTIHAIGAGLTLVEVQQYADITYRLYDYGRPRELHLDEAVEAAHAEPYRVSNDPFTQQDGSELLVAGPQFRLVRHHWKGTLDRPPQRITAPWWFIPLTGAGQLDGQDWQAGDCFLADSPAAIHANGEVTALFACTV